MDFTKKFNVGLTLETNLSKFNAFLERYHTYIHSVYFSPPIDRRFHTRSKIANYFLLPHKKKLFWQMLKLIKQYGIELELLLNTLCLNSELIEKASLLFTKRKIEIDSVCFIDKYYDDVMKYFPDKKYIYSFNNGFRTKGQIDLVIQNRRVNTFVLGSSFIRDNDLFAYLKDRKKEVYLLLNNSCSFNCKTCNTLDSTCFETFEQNKKSHSVEYLYALQSIYPNELRDGTINSSLVKCFKISNRGSNLTFIENALESYISNRVYEYVKSNPNNYAIWGRAGFFWKYFSSMDYEKILEYKQKILNHPINID